VYSSASPKVILPDRGANTMCGVSNKVARDKRRGKVLERAGGRHKAALSRKGFGGRKVIHAAHEAS